MVFPWFSHGFPIKNGEIWCAEEALSSQRCVSIGTMPWEMGNALVSWIQLWRTHGDPWGPPKIGWKWVKDLPIWWVLGFRSSFSPWKSGYDMLWLIMTGGMPGMPIFWTHPICISLWDGWVKKMRKDNNQQLATELWWWQVELHLWKNFGPLGWVTSHLLTGGRWSWFFWFMIIGKKCGLPLSGGIPVLNSINAFRLKAGSPSTMD